jgi:hypothetical protein
LASPELRRAAPFQEKQRAGEADHRERWYLELSGFVVMKNWPLEAHTVV